jgi:AraC-like DNA-binding protein
MHITPRLGPLEHLRLKAHWVYKRRRGSSYRLKGISSPYTIFWLILSGTNSIMVEGNWIVVKAGDLIVYPPQTIIKVLGESLEMFNYLSIGCDAKAGAFDVASIYDFPRITRLPDTPELARFIASWNMLIEYSNRIATDTNTREGNSHFILPDTLQYSFHIKFHALLLQWFSEMLDLMLPFLSTTPDKLDYRIYQACAFIREKLSTKLTLKDIANHVYLSQPHLRTLFHKSLGMPPMEFLRKERILRAKELLLSTDYMLREIAEQVGYLEQGQLSRAFRAAEGISPLEYRCQERLLH